MRPFQIWMGSKLPKWQGLKFSSKSPPLFLVPKQFYPISFAFPSCGFYKKQHVFNRHIILLTLSLRSYLENWIMAARHISIFWFITSLLLKSKITVLLPQNGAEKALSLVPLITSLVLSTCYLCAAVFLFMAQKHTCL